MQKRLAEILAYLDVSRTRVRESVAQVNSSFAEIRPRSEAWSVAEIVNHLAIVEANVAKLITRSSIWGRENGIGPETSDESVLRTLDSHSIAEGGTPFTAPERITPPRESKMEDAERALIESRRALRGALADADGLDLSAITRPHPRFGDLNMYQWALFVGQHDERHVRQIERTLIEVRESAAKSAPIF